MNVSKVFDSPMKTQTGTPYYASPEVWKEIEYTEKADIWSLGCLLYEMAALYPPFQAENMSDLSKKIIRGVYPNINEVYSNDLRQVIARLLQVVPEKRPSCGFIIFLPLLLINGFIFILIRRNFGNEACHRKNGEK